MIGGREGGGDVSLDGLFDRRTGGGWGLAQDEPEHWVQVETLSDSDKSLLIPFNNAYQVPRAHKNTHTL